MALTSNFRRQPFIRDFDGECTAHGSIRRSEVEQFDGSVLVSPCKKCHWDALNIAPRDSKAYTDAVAWSSADRLNSALIGSGITPRFTGSTFDNYRVEGNPDAAKALSTCREYVDQFDENYAKGRCLILSGNVGTGKTHLASGMVQAVVRQYRAAALIVSTAELVRVARGTMAKGATYTDHDWISELSDCDLLVIDEVGVQKGSDYELGLLHEVIDSRYQLVVPTVLISNLSTEDLARFVGDRALDRLRQNNGKAVGFTWESMRAKA